MPRIVFREQALDRYLNDPSGKVGEFLKERGRRILAAAKAQVGVQTGELRSSIHMRHFRDPRSQYIRIGSPLNYARAHHNGTAPHLIRPNNAKMLRFASKGQIVFAHMVRHPGTPANRYLTDNLRLIR